MVDSVARSVEAWLGGSSRRLLADLGHRSWEDLLRQHPRAAGAPTPPAVLAALRDSLAASDPARAVVISRALLAALEAALGSDHRAVLLEHGTLGALAERAGDPAEAERHLRAAWDALRFQGQPNDLALAVVAGVYGGLCARQGDLERAEKLMRQALGIRREVAPDTVELLAAQLGEVLVKRGQHQPAVPILRDAWQHARRVRGPTDPRTLKRARVLAKVLDHLGWTTEALPIHRDLVQAARATGDREAVLTALYELGLALSADHAHPEESLRVVEEATRIARELAPHPYLPRTLTLLSRLYATRGRGNEIEGLHREALECELQLHGTASTEVALRYGVLGQLAAAAGRPDEALGMFEAASSLLSSVKGMRDPTTRRAIEEWLQLVDQAARTASERGDRKLAIRMLARAMDVAIPALGHGDSLTLSLRRTRDELGTRRR